MQQPLNKLNIWQLLKTSSAFCLGYVTAGTFFVHGTFCEEMRPFSKSKSNFPPLTNQEHCFIMICLCQWRTQDLAKREGHNWGLSSGGPPTNFYDFHIKTLILTHFFTEKGYAVSAVTMDNAKIFSQLMCKSAQAWLKQTEVATIIGLKNYRLKVRS